MYLNRYILGGEHSEFFRNRKGYFSINTQVVCDSANRIMDIVARWPGSAHDSYIFSNSAIRTKFENGEFGNAVILGDSAYPLTNYLMTPLAVPQTRAAEKYNWSHIRTRTVVERTFGIWKRRFPILCVGIRCKLALAQKIIIATAVLQNIIVFLRDENDNAFDDENVLEINQEEDDVANEQQHVFNVIQQRYVNYFATLL